MNNTVLYLMCFNQGMYNVHILLNQSTMALLYLYKTR